MIKNILVALDESLSSTSAKILGMSLAKSYQASLTGIGILDEPWIVAPEAIPLGGAAFKVQLDEQFLKDARHRIHKLEKAFTQDCQSSKITSSIIDATGVPAYEIEHFITEYDLLIIGKDANFHFTAIEEMGVSTTQLIKDNPRPIILTGPTLPHPHSSHVFVAFDGTLASSRSLHIALLMGVFKGKTVHIASVSSDENEVRDLVNTASKLCLNHGIKAQLHPILTSDKPAKALLQLMDDIKPYLVVMGAYGHGGISYLFTGSCAKALLKATDIPLFIYH